MPEKGFSVLTVKEDHAQLLRSCYRALVEGSGVPMIIDKLVYDGVSEAVRRGEAKTEEDLIHAVIRGHLSKGQVTVVVPEGLAKLMRDLLKTEWYRKHHTPKTLEDMALRGIEEYYYRFIQHEVPRAYELVCQVATKQFLVGELDIYESLLTWMQVVGILRWRIEPPKIIEWRFREKGMTSDEYRPHLGALFGDQLYVVGGMAKNGGSEGRAYKDAIEYIESRKLQLEVRPGTDPTFQNFLRSVKDFYRRPKAERERLTYSLPELAERIRKIAHEE